jgi:hypothetical protein
MTPYPHDTRYLVGTDGTIVGSLGRPIGSVTCNYKMVRILNKTMLAARVVLETYVGAPPNENSVVRHLDGNSLNDALDNLAWGTHRDNYNDAVKHGTQALARSGERHPKAKLSDAEVAAIREEYAQGSTSTYLGRKYGTSSRNVLYIVNNASRTKNST